MNKSIHSSISKTVLIAFILPLISFSNRTTSFFDVSENFQDSTAKPVQVQVFDLRGQGDSIAVEKAIYNSKKNVLILLVRSTNPEHMNTVENCAHALIVGGRNRIVILLGDKAQGIINDDTLFFVNGEFVRAITQTPKKLTNNGTLINAISEEYDLHIK